MTRRLLATLSSIPAGSSVAPAGPFAPPYAHSAAAPPSASGSFRPPYAHSLPGQLGGGGAGPSRINAPHRFTIPTPSTSAAEVTRAEEWVRWAQGLVGSDKARAGTLRVWEETLEGLKRAKIDGVHIPEVSYSSLGEHLSNPSGVDAIKSTGSVIVRDVIPDSLALRWAREIWAATELRSGDAVYWHAALLEARSHVSVLNTTSSVLAAVVGEEMREAEVLAESAREGLGSDLDSGRWAVGNVNDIWAVNMETGPSTPLLSHLTLTPPSSTNPSLSSTIHGATYALLRPLFRPIRSRISFYSSAAYLDSVNWTIISPSDLTTTSAITPASATTSGGKPDTASNGLPHIADLPLRPLSLNPGDIILRNSLIPLSSTSASTSATAAVSSASASGQAFLPVSLLPQIKANGAYSVLQRKAYEAGLPPPLVSARGGIWGERGAIRVEQTTP